MHLETECPGVKAMESELQEIDGFAECFAKIGESRVYRLAAKCCRHIAYPVPAAILKGVEVACGLALPRDVEMKRSGD